MAWKGSVSVYKLSSLYSKEKSKSAVKPGSNTTAKPLGCTQSRQHPRQFNLDHVRVQVGEESQWEVINLTRTIEYDWNRHLITGN